MAAIEPAIEDTANSRLRQWRTERGLSLDDLADLTGRSKAYLSRVERGERVLPPLEKVRFARMVGARVRDLFDVESVQA